MRDKRVLSYNIDQVLYEKYKQYCQDNKTKPHKALIILLRGEVENRTLEKMVNDYVEGA